MTFLKGRIYQAANKANFEYIGKAEGRFSAGKLTFRSVETRMFINFNADGTNPYDPTLNLVSENKDIRKGNER